MKALSESYLSITCVICFLSDYFPSCLLLKLLPDRNSLKFGGGRGERKLGALNIPMSQSFLATIQFTCKGKSMIMVTDSIIKHIKRCTLIKTSVYPCHDSDDEVMEETPKHHHRYVGVVA